MSVQPAKFRYPLSALCYKPSCFRHPLSYRNCILYSVCYHGTYKFIKIQTKYQLIKQNSENYAF